MKGENKMKKPAKKVEEYNKDVSKKFAIEILDESFNVQKRFWFSTHDEMVNHYLLIMVWLKPEYIRKIKADEGSK